jgi:anti-sigma factor RsiW
MSCERDLLLDYARGKLDGETRARIAAHLEGCESCRAVVANEGALDQLLAEKLPRHPAPASLKRKLAPRPRRRFLAPVASAMAAAAIVLLTVRLTQPRFLMAGDPLVEEAVNDHLRLVSSEHPVEIANGGIHQVKPWFTGRLDFAPRVSFIGDETFQLEGGSVGYFRDRKAALFIFKVRLHTVSLMVVRAEGLAWPARAERVSRGFNVLLWRDGELGYALVSDVGHADLEALARKVSAP